MVPIYKIGKVDVVMKNYATITPDHFGPTLA